MIPTSCAASRASAICLAMGSASSSGRGPRAMRSDQILALDQFHHECGDVGGLLDAVDLCNVRVIQRREDLRFALEPGEPLRISGHRRGEHL